MRGDPRHLVNPDRADRVREPPGAHPCERHLVLDIDKVVFEAAGASTGNGGHARVCDAKLG